MINMDHWGVLFHAVVLWDLTFYLNPPQRTVYSEKQTLSAVSFTRHSTKYVPRLLKKKQFYIIKGLPEATVTPVLKTLI